MKSILLAIVACLTLTLALSLAGRATAGDCYGGSSSYYRPAVRSFYGPTYAPSYGASSVTHCGPGGCTTTLSGPSYVRVRVFLGYDFQGFPVWGSRLVRAGY